MPKKSYKSMSACMADYKGIKGAKVMCETKTRAHRKPEKGELKQRAVAYGTWNPDNPGSWGGS